MNCVVCGVPSGGYITCQQHEDPNGGDHDDD